MKDNIQSLLASKLRDLSLRFKKTQTDYLQSMYYLHNFYSVAMGGKSFEPQQVPI